MMIHDSERCDPAAGGCHLCGDAGVVGRVLSIDAATRTASVGFPDGAGPATVALDLVDAAVGDQLLVHLGFAIERLAGERA